MTTRPGDKSWMLRVRGMAHAGGVWAVGTPLHFATSSNLEMNFWKWLHYLLVYLETIAWNVNQYGRWLFVRLFQVLCQLSGLQIITR